MSDVISIDVWSDIACPWCYIGKRNLEAGLAQTATDEDAPKVEVTFHSYQLAPDTPVDFAGSEADFLAQHKGLPMAEVEQMLGQVTQVAANAGLTYHFDTVRHVNTALAHEVLHAARAAGAQQAVAERLLAAYFTEGRDLSDVDELVALGAAGGLDAEELRRALQDHRYRDAVRRDEAQAQAYGITGVPFFVIDGTYGVSGAQPPAAFAQIARQVWSEHRAKEASPDVA